MKLVDLLSRFTLVGALLYSGFGQALVIDFESLENSNNRSNQVGYIYEEDGFILTSLTTDGSNPHRFYNFGTESDFYAGSTGLFNNTPDGITELRLIDGGSFDFLSIDLAELTQMRSAEVMFVGEFADGTTVSRRYFTDGDLGYQTRSFVNFDDIVLLSWQQLSPYHQFDNITVSGVQTAAPADFPIPAPATLALLPLGLMLLAASKKKT